ncbi:MAG: Serine-type D-Ala-D-Ala carboxypeptidase [Parcubacteria group bacterium GW2011_GWA1_47_8]|nr:MAG: Serine-type D-Ala-D-Ala carboxypeptidase [Parcubacteria group bacterium GW2011_GWA1_47_8]
MMVMSSNDAAHAIAEFVGSEGQNTYGVAGRAHFITLMNEKAHTLGLTSMEFFNETGLDAHEVQTDVSVQAGGYGSAHDIALLFRELEKKFPDTVAPTTRSAVRLVSQSGALHILPNTNEALEYFPGLIASKTGYTTLAGGNLAIIFDVGMGHPIVAVVLGSTYKGRFDDMRAIVEATHATVE